MIHNRLGRALVTATLVGSAAFATLATAGPASAAGTGIKCKSLTGNIAGNVTLAKCSGNTGKASKPLPATALASGGTITWVNNKTTTVTLKVNQGDASKCPAGDSEFDAKGKVTADTTGSTAVGNKVKASVCVTPAGAVSLVPGTSAVIK